MRKKPKKKIQVDITKSLKKIMYHDASSAFKEEKKTFSLFRTCSFFKNDKRHPYFAKIHSHRVKVRKFFNECEKLVSLF